MIRPNGHNDKGNSEVIQEPARETVNNTPLLAVATAPSSEVATRKKQRAKQQIQQNRFVIIGAGAVVVALLIFVATSMPHRGVTQKGKGRGVAATEESSLESSTESTDKSLFPITDSGRPNEKETHDGFLNERDLQRTAKPAPTLGSIPSFGEQTWQAPPYQPSSDLGPESLFCGRRGNLEMELWGKDVTFRGTVCPVFFTRAGENVVLPNDFQRAVTRITSAVCCLGCRHCHLLRPNLVGVDRTENSNALDVTDERSASVDAAASGAA